MSLRTHSSSLHVTHRSVYSWKALLLAAGFGLALLLSSGAQAQEAVPQARNQAVTLIPSLAQQVQALIQEKVTRTPAQRKIDSHLLYTIKIDRNDPIMQQVPKLRPALNFTPTGRVEVDIKAAVSPLLLQAIRQLGGDILSSVPQYNAIRAELPLRQIETLASSSAVQFIKPAVHPFHNTDSEGDVCHEADQARQVLGLTGQGVSVGVISGDVLYLSNLQKAGLLPSVGVLKGQSGLVGNGSPATNPQADGEGTAMLEIVHDVAPNASLYFATADPSDAQFALNIRDLYSQAHCNIIVDDVGFPDESPFQDGIVAQAVNTVTQNGVLYFSCARNTGNLDSSGSGTGSGTWEGDYADSKTAYNFTWGGSTYTEEMHTFGPSIFNEFANSSVITLFWADPLGAAGDDYDLYAVDSKQQFILDASTNLQDGQQDPYEYLAPNQTLPDGSYLMVGLYNGAGRFLYLEAGINNGPLLQYATAGSTRGHNAAASAFTIGAVDVAQSYPGTFSAGNTIETFSADGPRQIFFNPDGSAITPGNFSSTGGKVLAKPDFAAADGVTTDVPNFAPFHGTSAAAPHAAAIAALLMSYQPSLTYSELGAVFDASAWKIMNDGNDWNRDAGYGLIDALGAAVTLVAVSLNPTIQISPNPVTGPASATGTITLSTPAPPSGLPFSLSSDNASATVPSSLTIPAGATSANFTISAKKVAANTTANITATSFPQFGGVTQATGALTVVPPIGLSKLSVSPSAVIGGTSATGTVTLSGNATANTAVTLSSNNTAAAKVPSSVTVSSGSGSATFTVTTLAVSADTTVTVSAKLGAVTKTATIKVQAATLSSLALNPSTVKGGANVTGTVTLTGPTAAAIKVTLSNTNKAATVPASVTIAKGQSSATFTIKTTTPSGSGNSVGNVTAKLGTLSKSQTLTVTH